MAISEFETKKIKKLVGQFVEKRRPRSELRPKLDLGFRITGQSFEIYEIRPRWNNSAEKMESPVAKGTYVKNRNEWKLFWRRADLKWHGYQPFPASKFLEKILEEIDRDPYGCFWG